MQEEQKMENGTKGRGTRTRTEARTKDLGESMGGSERYRKESKGQTTEGAIENDTW